VDLGSLSDSGVCLAAENLPLPLLLFAPRLHDHPRVIVVFLIPIFTAASKPDCTHHEVPCPAHHTCPHMTPAMLWGISTSCCPPHGTREILAFPGNPERNEQTLPRPSYTAFDPGLDAAYTHRKQQASSRRAGIPNHSAIWCGANNLRYGLVSVT